MFRNYFYLYRCVTELNKSLTGAAIIEAFTQEKDKLFLKIPLAGRPDYHLILDSAPLIGCIFSRERHFKAKKNTISFFDNYLPDKILSSRIALNDRVLKFNMGGSSLHFVIKGAGSNVFLTSADRIESFKKSDSYLNDIPNDWIMDEQQLFNFLNIITIHHLEWKNFSSSFPFAGKDIFLESKAKITTESVEEFIIAIRGCIEHILKDKIIIYYDYNESKPKFIPESFLKSVPENDTIRLFDEYFPALNYYFQIKYKNRKEVSTKTKIEKYIDSELEKMSSKLNNLKFRIDAGSKESEYRISGNLLLMNIRQIVKGSKGIEVEDPETGQIISIKLEPKLSPQKNIDRYFEKSKDEKISFEQSKEIYKASLLKLNRLNEIKTKINSDATQEELDIIFNKLKVNRQSKASTMEEKNNYKHYLLHGKYHVFVGKDSHNNDELTTKFAKQNDLWFHARGVSGSHVVLRVDNTKEVVPKNIIKEAASLAAYYSKAKTSGVAPVSYTFRKFVHKKKGLNPGQVILTKESVVLVKPEIPKECEPVITDLI